MIVLSIFISMLTDLEPILEPTGGLEPVQKSQGPWATSDTESASSKREYILLKD